MFKSVDYLEKLFKIICHLRPHFSQDLSKNHNEIITSFNKILDFLNKTSIEKIKDVATSFGI